MVQSLDTSENQIKLEDRIRPFNRGCVEYICTTKLNSHRDRMFLGMQGFDFA